MVKVTAPVNAFANEFKSISASVANVVKEEVPVTVTAAPWVMFPVVAVMIRFPPTARSVLPSMSSSPSASVAADV